MWWDTDWKRDPRWAYLFVNLSTLLWASNIMLGRALREQIGPLTLTAMRFLVAGTIFGVILKRTGLRVLGLNEDWKGLLAMGLTGIFAFPALLYLALQQTTASNASLINGTGPLITMILAAFLLKEALKFNRINGAFISLVGVGFIVGGPPSQMMKFTGFNTGDLIVLVDVGIWGLYSIIGRRIMRVRPALETTAISIWFALPFLLLAAALETKIHPPTLTWPVILSGIYIGVFPSCVAFFAWNEGIRRVGPARAMAFYNMLPVFGVALAATFLGEKPGWWHLVGGALVIMGGLLALKPAQVTKRQGECGEQRENP